MFVEGKVTDLAGKPVANAVIDTWETDGHGQYDTQVRKSTPFSMRTPQIYIHEAP